MPRAKTSTTIGLNDDQATALSKHGEPGRDSDAVADDYERALLEELHGYEVHGREERIADVTAEVERHRAAKSRAAAGVDAVEERSAQPQETADLGDSSETA